MHPCDLRRVGDAVIAHWVAAGKKHQLYAIDDLGVGAGGEHEGAGDVNERLAVGGVRRVEKNEVADAVGGAIGDAGNHHAAIAVAHQDDVAQILELQQFDDVGNVGVEIDGR